MKFGKQQNLSLLYILFGMALFAMTSQIKYRFAVATEDVGPDCCAAGIVLCGLGKFVSSLGKGSGKPFIGSLSGWGRMAVILLVLLLYVYGLKYIGYLASGFLLMTALVLMLGLDRRPPLWKAMVFSAVVTLSTYLFFENAVHVLLPSGVWMKPLLRALR